MIFIAKAWIAVWFVVFSCAASAQVRIADTAVNVEELLRKRDLLTVIAETEKVGKSDIASLFFRLDLYSRAAHGRKMSATLDQIIAASEVSENPLPILSRASDFAKDPLVTNSRLMFRFLRSEFNEDIFGKLLTICESQRSDCDIEAIDRWLAEKTQAVPDTDRDIFINPHSSWAWVGRWINWRQRLGADLSGITAQFADAVRKDPTELGAALRFGQFAQSAQEISWLAETFSSDRSYDYFELGSRISNQHCCSRMSDADRSLANFEGSKLLRKSLDLPFSQNDVRLMGTYRLSGASVPPKIGNYEKQLRFWTKKELAEVYLRIGRPADAQPLVEELANTDTSDILPDSTAQLAGASQMVSGARVVESKILAEQAAKQDTYKYWSERIEYYRGRKEPVQVFDAYLQALKVVPADPTERYSGEGRLRFIGNFAEFATDSDFGMGGVEFSNLDELRERFEKETEAFLADEFELTKKHPRYAYQLLEIIRNEDFDELSEKLLPEYPRIILGAYQSPSSYREDGLVRQYLESETIDQSKKGILLTSLLRIAAKLNARDALPLCEMLVGLDQTSHIPRLIPFLIRNYRATKNLAYDEDYFVSRASREYPEMLFKAYVRINDWRSGEKFFNENPDLSLSSPYEQLALAAARSGSTREAMRFWKTNANLNRRDLDYLSSYRQHPAFVEQLRKFYVQMKTDEPYSPVPELALKALM